MKDFLIGPKRAGHTCSGRTHDNAPHGPSNGLRGR